MTRAASRKSCPPRPPPPSRSMTAIPSVLPTDSSAFATMSIAVLAVVAVLHRVAALADVRPCSDRSPSNASQKVLLVCDWLKVVRVHAVTHSTQMVQKEAIGNGATMSFVHDSVASERSAPSATDLDTRIAGTVAADSVGTDPAVTFERPWCQSNALHDSFEKSQSVPLHRLGLADVTMSVPSQVVHVAHPARPGCSFTAINGTRTLGHVGPPWGLTGAGAASTVPGSLHCTAGVSQ